MITYIYYLNREPLINKDRYNHDKKLFKALIELSVNGLLIGFVLFSKLCHKLSPLLLVSLSAGVAFSLLVQASVFPFL